MSYSFRSTQSDFAALNAKLLASGEYSDMAISVGGRVFKVHRNIVCSQSQPFAAAMKEDKYKASSPSRDAILCPTTNNLQEGCSGMIDLPEDDAYIVEKMLEYLYTGNYSISFDKSTTAETGTLLAHTRMYIIGDKYDIPGLKKLSAKIYGSQVLRDSGTPSFTASLELMFKETVEKDRDLKDVAMEFLIENARHFLARDDFATVCKENGDIGYELATAAWSQGSRAGTPDSPLALPPACPICKSSSRVIKGLGLEILFPNKWFCGSCSSQFT